jgi:hypothetical protein
MQQLKRMGVGSGSEEDATHSGDKPCPNFLYFLRLIFSTFLWKNI